MHTEKVTSRETLFLLKISKNLRMSFTEMAQLAGGLYLIALLTTQHFYLPYRKGSSNSVHYGMAVHFAFKNVNKQ
jgi:hypothetical protein